MTIDPFIADATAGNYTDSSPTNPSTPMTYEEAHGVNEGTRTAFSIAAGIAIGLGVIALQNRFKRSPFGNGRAR
jgi:hypothetical protein